MLNSSQYKRTQQTMFKETAVSYLWWGSSFQHPRYDRRLCSNWHFSWTAVTKINKIKKLSRQYFFSNICSNMFWKRKLDTNGWNLKVRQLERHFFPPHHKVGILHSNTIPRNVSETHSNRQYTVMEKPASCDLAGTGLWGTRFNNHWLASYEPG